MENFNVEKYGYDKKEVDNYLAKLKENYEETLSNQKDAIFQLKQQLEENQQKLNKYVQKNEDISDALVVAVETAKQIENSSKNIYELEIKRLRALYVKWDNFLNDLIAEYPKLKEKFDTKALLKIFSDGIDNVIKQNSETIQPSPVQAMGLRNLINKMSNINAKTEDQNSQIKQSVIKNQTPKEDYYSDNLTSIGTIPQQSFNTVDKYSQLRLEQLKRKQEIREQMAKQSREEKVLTIGNVQKVNKTQEQVVKSNTEVEDRLREFSAMLSSKNIQTSAREVDNNKANLQNRADFDDNKQEKMQSVKENPVNKKEKIDETRVIVRKEKPSYIEDKQPEQKKTKIKAISKLTLNKDEKFENLVDKFLSAENNLEEGSSEYEKALLQKKQKENGFDLSEALNPTDDLSEIMKSFDAFNDGLLDINPDDPDEK